MNKTAIKNFAIWARNKLIADIHYRAGLLGITAEGIANPLPQSTHILYMDRQSNRESVWWNFLIKRQKKVILLQHINMCWKRWPIHGLTV